MVVVALCVWTHAAARGTGTVAFINYLQKQQDEYKNTGCSDSLKCIKSTVVVHIVHLSGQQSQLHWWEKLTLKPNLGLRFTVQLFSCNFKVPKHSSTEPEELSAFKRCQIMSETSIYRHTVYIPILNLWLCLSEGIFLQSVWAVDEGEARCKRRTVSRRSWDRTGREHTDRTEESLRDVLGWIHLQLSHRTTTKNKPGGEETVCSRISRIKDKLRGLRAND